MIAQKPCYGQVCRLLLASIEFHAQGIRAECSVPAVRLYANMDLTQEPHWLIRAVNSLQNLTRLSLFLQVPMPGSAGVP